MSFYNKYILPKLVHWTCQTQPAMKQRGKIIPYASGHVLEIGIGSGLNLSYYSEDKVKSVTGIDPSEEIWNQRDIQIESFGFPIQYVRAYARDMPFGSNTFDTVITTYSLCSIHQHEQTFEEIRRVLKPGGRFYFCEHGKAPDKGVQRWQNWITPVWKQVGGGCHLNKDIPKIITSNGFQVQEMEGKYIPGWKPANFIYKGKARMR